MNKDDALEPMGAIQRRILQIRGQRIILDIDLAKLFGTTTKRLNEQVKRNSFRFPADFMFQLDPTERAEVVANCDHLSVLKYSTSMPFAFTEHGTIMAANVLNSEQAVRVSVLVVRAFVKLREVVGAHKELAQKIAELENRLETHDEAILGIMETIRLLMEPPPEPRRSRIGFEAEQEGQANESE